MIVANSVLRPLRLVLGLLVVGCSAKVGLAQGGDEAALSVKFVTLHSFTGADGAYPSAALVQAFNGDFYGTTTYGGANCAATVTCGTVFKITPSGVLTTLYNFCAQTGCTDGSEPGGLVQATNGLFYGTTFSGGAYGYGTVFRMTPSGGLTTLHSFCSQAGCPDGSQPAAGLVQAANGNLYGTTYSGGSNGNSGTVFKITPSGTLTTIYSFCAQSGCADGSGPQAGLIQATNGDLYGNTTFEGANSSACFGGGFCGTIFKITPSDALTTIYSFCALPGCSDGEGPGAALVQARNLNLYGTAQSGGANCLPQGCGTVFRTTPNGTLTTLYSFCSKSNCADGNQPLGLIQAASGNLYGTTTGAINYGTIFKITPTGSLTTIYSFCSQTGCTDGIGPFGGLVQGTNGTFYGAATGGGANGYGTIFALSNGQTPFVETRPIISKVGGAVAILGYKLTGATSITFNGIPSAFRVVSSTEITTTVPAGATTGKVQVVTPSGTLSSNVAFEVVP